MARPAQIPADNACFSGRSEPIRHLDTIIADKGGGLAVTTVIISGPPGVGKSSLAVHWAHRVADQFPDGSLYVDLRGFSPSAPPLCPGEAVQNLLTALGVPAGGLPVNADAQISLYRSLLSGKRMLLLLDNARDADQVRPLLPSSPNCFVAITSRTPLTGLVAVVDARLLTLGLFDADESRELLVRLVGHGRVAAEAAAADTLVELCARLPLAVAVAGARAATRPKVSLTVFAAQLRQAHHRLDALDTADPATDIRAVFSSSYEALSAQAKRTFRLLGMHPGQDFTAPAAASLAAAPPARAGQALTELTRAYLLTERTPGRYAFHDLVRLYAQEQAARESEAERRAARCRMLDHYLHAAYVATLRWDRPVLDPPNLDPPEQGVSRVDIRDHDDALTWLRSEHQVLACMIRYAAAYGFDSHAWRLAWTLTRFLDRQGYWETCIGIQRVALSCARRLADEPGQANAYLCLGRGFTRLGRPDVAEAQYQQAMCLYRNCGDLAGQAITHLNLCLMWEGRHEFGTALTHAAQALQLYEQLGHPTGRANALNDISSLQSELGQYRLALESAQQALKLSWASGDYFCQACALDSLGYAHYHLGRYRSALACYQQALKRFRSIGDRFIETQVLAHIADAYGALGNASAARIARMEASGILDTLHPRTSLASLRNNLDQFGYR